MYVCFIPPYTPLLYSKTGVYRGIHYFLIFALKHRLWVLVRTVPTIYVLSKNKKKVNIFSTKNYHFTAVKYYSILHGHVFVMATPDQALGQPKKTSDMTDNLLTGT